MTWDFILVGAILVVLLGVAMLFYARALRRTSPPKALDGAMTGALPGRDALGQMYQRRDRASYLTWQAVGTIAVAGAIVLVSGWHLLGH